MNPNLTALFTETIKQKTLYNRPNYTDLWSTSNTQILQIRRVSGGYDFTNDLITGG